MRHPLTSADGLIVVDASRITALSVGGEFGAEEDPDLIPHVLAWCEPEPNAVLERCPGFTEDDMRDVVASWREAIADALDDGVQRSEPEVPALRPPGAPEPWADEIATQAMSAYATGGEAALRLLSQRGEIIVRESGKGDLVLSEDGLLDWWRYTTDTPVNDGPEHLWAVVENEFCRAVFVSEIRALQFVKDEGMADEVTRVTRLNRLPGGWW